VRSQLLIVKAQPLDRRLHHHLLIGFVIDDKIFAETFTVHL
jgi:hypothetical protein